MSIIEYGGKNADPMSVEDAVSKLKGRIRHYRLRHLRALGRGALILAKTLIVAFVVMLLEFIFINSLFGGLWFGISFIASCILLAGGAILEFRRDIKKKPGKDSILLGRSFRHYTESRNSERQSRAVEVGSDGLHFLDYIHEPNPHVLINGSTSSGKTATMLSFIARASLVNGLNFILIDLNGENEQWGRSTGATVWKVPKNFKINLFMLNGLSKEERASRAVENLIVAAKLTALQSTKVKSALLRFYLNGKEPSLYELWRAICGGDAGKGNVLNQRLRAIQRVIGTEPREFWESIFSGNNIISLAGLNESEKALVVYAVTQRLMELFDKSPELNARLKLMVVMDEAWQFLKRENEFETHRESSMERIVRLGRKYGFGLVLATQQLEDVPKVFINSCAVLMLHQQREHAYYGREILSLGPFENAYLNQADQGELLLLDRGAMQKGQWWSEYVKVERFSETDARRLSERSAAGEPTAIDEIEMPIEGYDVKTESALSDTAMAEGNMKKGLTRKKLTIPLDLPTPPQYAGLLAIYNNPKANSEELIRYIKTKRWFTSPNTLYGAGGKPGILGGLVPAGLAKSEGKHYALTDNGRKWVDSELIMANQADKLGSEEHKQLMRKVIRNLQDELQIAVVGREKHSFDILAFPVNVKKRGLWNLKKAKGYEVQTSARKDSLADNKDKVRIWGVPIVWVADNKDVLKKIKHQTGDYGEFMTV